MCCGCGDFHVLIWCCLLICAFQEVLRSCLQVHHRSSFHICTSRPVTGVTQTHPRWPPQCWNNSFSHNRGLSQTPTVACFFFFVCFAPSGSLLRQIPALQTHRFSSVGRKKGRAGCLNCNCDQDQFAGYLRNESKEAGAGTFSFSVFR